MSPKQKSLFILQSTPPSDRWHLKYKLRSLADAGVFTPSPESDSLNQHQGSGKHGNASPTRLAVVRSRTAPVCQPRRLLKPWIRVMQPGPRELLSHLLCLTAPVSLIHPNSAFINPKVHEKLSSLGRNNETQRDYATFLETRFIKTLKQAWLLNVL